MSAKPDPSELLSLLVAIARAGDPRHHISSEFKRCADGSYAGSNADTFSLPPALPQFPTGASTPLTGINGSVRHIEDSWWVDQDKDEAWARQWENDTDTADPKSYK